MSNRSIFIKECLFLVTVLAFLLSQNQSASSPFGRALAAGVVYASDRSSVSLIKQELESKIIRGPTPADLIKYAFLNNPSIQAARDAWKGTLERYRVTTAYPDPQLTITYFPEPIETRLGPQDWSINLLQTIPFPGRLSKSGELVKADARMAGLSADKAVRDVVVKLRESYQELLYIGEAKKILAQNLMLLEHIREVGETAYAQERTTFFDVVKVQSQSAQLQYDVVLLKELEQTEKTRINSLLNRPPGADLGPLTHEPLSSVLYNLDEIYRLAKQYQEEIQIAEAQVEKSQARTELATFENLPEFRVGLFYASIGNPNVPVPPKDAGRDAIGVQFGVSIPLWFGKNTGRQAEAQAEVQKARAMVTAQVNETYAQIRDLYFRLRNAERLIRLYRDQLLPQAAQSMEIAETWFREKQGSFSDFAETQAVFYNFELALARAKADYGKFLARLERFVGRSLTERGEDTSERSHGEGSQ